MKNALTRIVAVLLAMSLINPHCGFGISDRGFEGPRSKFRDSQSEISFGAQALSQWFSSSPLRLRITDPAVVVWTKAANLGKGDAHGKGDGSWLPWRWYKRYVAAGFETYASLKLGLLFSPFVRNEFLRPDSAMSLGTTISLALGTGIAVGVASTLIFRYLHVFRGKAVMNNATVKGLSYGMAAVGFVTGAISALPHPISPVSLIFMAVAALPALGLALRHQIVNWRDTQTSPQVSMDRRAVLADGLALTGSLFLLPAAAMESAGAMIDTQIRYFEPSEAAWQSLQDYRRSLEDPLPNLSIPQRVFMPLAAWRTEFEKNIQQLSNAHAATQMRSLSENLLHFVRTLDPLTLDFETIQRLLNFIQAPSPIHGASLEARENIFLVKRILISAVVKRVWEEKPSQKSLDEVQVGWMAGILVRLLDYEEQVEISDSRFPAYLPFDEQTFFTHRYHDLILDFVRPWLHIRPQAESRTVNRMASFIQNEVRARQGRGTPKIDEAALRGQVREMDPVLGMTRFMLRAWERQDVFLQRWVAREDRVNQARQKSVQGVPSLLGRAVKEIQELPGDFVEALKHEAQGHSRQRPPMPAEVLGCYPFAEPEHDMSFARFFKTLAARFPRTTLGKISEVLSHDAALRDFPLFPDVIAYRWKDFFGSFLGGKNSIGVYQLRPAQIRRYRLLEGSDRQISQVLLDPVKNVATYAAFVDAVANEVETMSGWARQTQVLIAQGRLADAAELQKRFDDKWRNFAAESVDPLKGEDLRYGAPAVPQSMRFFAALPTEAQMGMQWWRLALLHPLYGVKIANSADQDGQFAFLVSSVLETKPVALLDKAIVALPMIRLANIAKAPLRRRDVLNFSRLFGKALGEPSTKTRDSGGLTSPHKSIWFAPGLIVSFLAELTGQPFLYRAGAIFSVAALLITVFAMVRHYSAFRAFMRRVNEWLSAATILAVYAVSIGFNVVMLSTGRPPNAPLPSLRWILLAAAPLFLAGAGLALQFIDPFLVRMFGTERIDSFAQSYIRDLRQQAPEDHRLRAGLNLSPGMERVASYEAVLGGGKNHRTGGIYYQAWMLAFPSFMKYVITRRALGLEFDLQSDFFVKRFARGASLMHYPAWYLYSDVQLLRRVHLFRTLAPGLPWYLRPLVWLLNTVEITVFAAFVLGHAALFAFAVGVMLPVVMLLRPRDSLTYIRRFAIHGRFSARSA